MPDYAAECARFIVLGPLVAELASPHLIGRYMSLYGLTFTVGVALGPAVGGAMLATSPNAVWWCGTLVLTLTAVGLLRLGDAYPTHSVASTRWRDQTFLTEVDDDAELPTASVATTLIVCVPTASRNVTL
jgi:MFS family permease